MLLLRISFDVGANYPAETPGYNVEMMVHARKGIKHVLSSTVCALVLRYHFRPVLCTRVGELCEHCVESADVQV